MKIKPADILSKIFAEFARRRQQEKVSAWLWLQQSLSENASILVPEVVSLKDLIAAIGNAEDQVKGATGNGGESPSEYLERWLSGGKVVTQ